MNQLCHYWEYTQRTLNQYKTFCLKHFFFFLRQCLAMTQGLPQLPKARITSMCHHIEQKVLWYQGLNKLRAVYIVGNSSTRKAYSCTTPTPNFWLTQGKQFYFLSQKCWASVPPVRKLNWRTTARKPWNCESKINLPFFKLFLPHICHSD